MGRPWPSTRSLGRAATARPGSAWLARWSSAASGRRPEQQGARPARPAGRLRTEVTDRAFQGLGDLDDLAQLGVLVAAHQSAPLRTGASGQIEQLGLGSTDSLTTAARGR